MPFVSKSVLNIVRTTVLGAAIGVLALGSSVHAAPVSSALDLRPRADGTINAYSDSQGATIGPLGGTTTSVGVNGNSTTSTATASFVSAGQGSVSLTNTWNMVANGAFDFSSGVRQFSYRFIADANGLFQMNWTQTLSNTTFGSQFFVLDLENITTSSTQSQQAVGFNTTGSQSFNLISGDEYEFGIRETSNAAGAIAGSISTHALTLDWTAPINDPVVVAVPEPAPFAVVGLGLICLGLGHRRRLI